MIQISDNNGWSAEYRLLENGMRVTIKFNDMLVRTNVLLAGKDEKVARDYMRSLR